MQNKIRYYFLPIRLASNETFKNIKYWCREWDGNSHTQPGRMQICLVPCSIWWCHQTETVRQQGEELRPTVGSDPCSAT